MEAGEGENMKRILPFLFFLVTWNQYEVVCTTDKGITFPEFNTFEVQITTHTQRLENVKDVDLFTGVERVGDVLIPFEGLLPKGAFNFRVEEKK
jgi:hypothetical protein